MPVPPTASQSITEVQSFLMQAHGYVSGWEIPTPNALQTDSHSFEPEDIENLNTGEAIARVERPEYDFSLTTTPLETSDLPDITW